MYDIKFDRKNTNMIVVRKDGKLVTTVCCPPIDKGCDIINFSDKLSSGYTHNFDGLVVITNERTKSIYYKGDRLDCVYTENEKEYLKEIGYGNY